MSAKDELTDAQVDAAIPAEVYNVHEGEGRWTAATIRAAYRAGYQAGRTPEPSVRALFAALNFDGASLAEEVKAMRYSDRLDLIQACEDLSDALDRH